MTPPRAATSSRPLPPAPPVPAADVAARPDAVRPVRERPGRFSEDPLRPLTVLAVGLPLWWLLGLASLGWFILAGVMAVALGRRRRIALPAGFGWWLLFCLWLVLSTLMLGVDPPGTVSGSAGSRLVPVLFRFAEYAAATITLLWVHDSVVRGGQAARRSLLRAVGFLLTWTVLGGLLGVLAPQFELTSPVELALPGSLRSVAYVSALVHPSAAQVQDVIGLGDARPSAPYPYTNTWGNAIGLLLPWVLALVLSARRGPRRLLVVALAVVAVVPVVISLNRGLWIGLVVCLATAASLLLRDRRVVALACLVAAGLLTLTVLALSPLGQVAAERQQGDAPSDDIRGWSAARAVELATQSPVLGYGSTRAQQGSLDTIAVGKSDDCTNCGNLPIGTNGQVWFTLVGQGLPGTAAYLAFHLVALRRLWSTRGVVAACGTMSVAASIWFSFVYDRTGPTGCLQMLLVAGALALSRRRLA